MVAFENLRRVLDAGGIGLDQLIEMTTFHVELQTHLDLFKEVRDEFLHPPWPAWSAIGTTELATPGVRLEIRAIARIGAKRPDRG